MADTKKSNPENLGLTSGPWEIFRASDGTPLTIVAKGSSLLAVLSRAPGASREQFERDARAMAAAPEMLDSLKYAILLLPAGATKDACIAAVQKAGRVQ